MRDNLISVRRFLTQRNSHINIIISYMDKASKNTDITIFKSSIMLMLYNEIEGTFSNILTALFDYIIDENIDFNLLHRKIQKVYMDYYLRKTSNNVEQLKSFYNNTDLKNVDYLELNKYLKLYSGNLDSRQIRDISKRIGVPVSNSIQGENLLKVKSCRNKLAHGEVSYQEACRDFSEKDIRDIAAEVFQFLEMLITDYNNFINRQLISK